MNRYYQEKTAGIGDALSGVADAAYGALPMVGGGLLGAGAAGGLLGLMQGGSGIAKKIAPVIGAAMGAYAASQVENAIDQNAQGIDLNSQLAIQNGLANLDQAQQLQAMSGGMLPPGMGMGLGMPGMGPGMGMGLGMPGMGPGMGPGGGAMDGSGMAAMGMQPSQNQVIQAPNAIQEMQKKSSSNALINDAYKKLNEYFG